MEETEAKKESVPARVQFQHLLLLLLLISIDSYDVDFSLSRADPSLADGYTYVSKSWPKLEQHVQRNMPRMAIESFRIKEVVLLVAALIVAVSAYLLKGVYSTI